MKKLFSWLLATTFLVAAAPLAARAYLYNQGQTTKQLIVDKQLKQVNEGQWHDNLGSKVAFNRGDLIDFRLIIRNSGDSDLESVVVNDILPNYLQPIFYPGQYDKQKKKIIWRVGTLKAGQEVIKRFRFRVDPKANLPSKPLLLLNKAEVKSGSLNDSDRAMFFVVNKKLPRAGGNIILASLMLLGLLGLGIIGRKIGRGQLFSSLS